MAAIFGEGKIFGKLHRLHSLDTLWVKNSVEIALSLTVSEILANYSKVVLKIHNEVPITHVLTKLSVPNAIPSELWT